jgi:hypothetical protein
MDELLTCKKITHFLLLSGLDSRILSNTNTNLMHGCSVFGSFLFNTFEMKVLELNSTEKSCGSNVQLSEASYFSLIQCEFIIKI